MSSQIAQLLDLKQIVEDDIAFLTRRLEASEIRESVKYKNNIEGRIHYALRIKQDILRRIRHLDPNYGRQPNTTS